jgi:hypothetical protein
MVHLHPTLAPIRNQISVVLARGGAIFWVVTALIALLIPFPIAAPVVAARLRRHWSEVQPPNKE